MRPMEAGIYPFWFWNGDLDEDDVRRQVAEKAAKGVKGFYIHPRQGLRRPYLSESFFGMVAAAAEHGLTVELYDEYPYPSGVAGGEVVLGRPEHMATRLVQERFDVAGGPVRRELPAGEVLCCCAYPVDGDRVDGSRLLDVRHSVGPVLVKDSYHEGARRRTTASATWPAAPRRSWRRRPWRISS